MNMNLTGIIILATGCILIYGAVKNKNPIDVVKESLGGKPADGPNTSAGAIDPNNPAHIAAEQNRLNMPGGANFVGPVSPFPSN